MWKKLAKWVVQHGLDELMKELARDQARQGSGVPPASSIPPNVASFLSQGPIARQKGG